MQFNPEFNADHFNHLGADHLPAYLAIQVIDVGQGFLKAQLKVQQHHLAPNGFLHAASVVALADTSAGYACVAHLPDHAHSFTTLELKSNFVSSARIGDLIACEATAIHLGRTTHLWEARVFNAETNRLMASFACTQLLLQQK